MLKSHRTHLPEHVHIELLEAGTCDGRVEVDTLVQGVDFNGRLSSGREGTLGPLARRAKATKGTGIVADVLLVLPLELLLFIKIIVRENSSSENGEISRGWWRFVIRSRSKTSHYMGSTYLDEVVDHSVIEVLSSQMSVSSGGLHLEDTLLNGQQRHIEGATSQIKDEHVLLANRGVLLIKSVGDGSSRRLVDDTHDVETRNHTSILGGLAL